MSSVRLISRFSSLSLSGTIFGILLVGMAGQTCAQTRFEIRPLETITLSNQQFLVGDKNGKPVTLAGELRIPRPGTDKLPAVILLHSGMGIQLHHDRWAQELNSISAATLLLDSLSGRGLEKRHRTGLVSRCSGCLSGARSIGSAPAN
jgi:hypothetical protein